MLLPLLMTALVPAGGPARGVASPASPALETRVPAIALAPLARLPANASPAALSTNCSHLLTAPTSDAGRQVRSLGWGVTADLTIGGRSVVSFVGSTAPATSGTCELQRGNIAIFDGSRLIALAYARPAAGRSIGRISALAGGGVRVWDGDLVPRPVADLTVHGDGSVRVDKVAREDPVCDRAAMVPTIYDLPIDRARAALAKAGWTPVPATNSDGDERVGALAAAGIVEAEACAGTGFGFCSFGYRSSAGTLAVITVGDGPMPIVSSYRVECRRR